MADFRVCRLMSHNFTLLLCLISVTIVPSCRSDASEYAMPNFSFNSIAREWYQEVATSSAVDENIAGTGHHHGGSGQEVFNVMLEGASGDGRTDDGQAFRQAWGKTCQAASSTMFVPAGYKFSLRPSVFAGPCAPNLLLQVEGTIVAMEGPGSRTGSKSEWLEFKNLQNFSVVGGGRINGRGKRWWAQACRPTMTNCQPNAEVPPNALVFRNCSNVRVSRLRIRESPKFHLSFVNCDGVRATGLQITAPKSSPNTDGIHLQGSHNVFILNSHIRTGDDCVSIQTGSSRVLIQDTICGPGHGISIGSLGKAGSTSCVWGVTVNRVTFDRTTNGFRIKSWQGGLGHAHGMKFLNSKMNSVRKPVVIDQYYCDAVTPCANKTNAVAISEIIIANITGTSATSTAVYIKCSDTVPCRNIVLENINVKPGFAKLDCWNAYGFISGIEDPGSCALLRQPAVGHVQQDNSTFESC